MKYIDASDYKLEIGSLEKSSFSSVLASYKESAIVIVVDENTHQHCLPYLITTFSELSKAEVIVLPKGEENKQFSIVFNVWEALTEYQISRSDLIINLGGGMITDMGGFIASCYKRGCDFINIPTSLLGMVDASIGGKTGVNLDNYKNQIGVFANPKIVYIDTSFLQSLPTEELKNGYAEIIKHGLITSQELYLTALTKSESLSEIDEAFLLQFIEVKNDIVKKDPKEKGLRKILNFGHTIGHVIEGHFMDSLQISHGHSVAIGMVMEAFLSTKHSTLNKKSYSSIEKALFSQFSIPKLNDKDIQSMISMLSNDKKNSKGRINVCLLKSIGNCTYDNYLNEKSFMEMFLHFKNLQINLN